MATPSPFQAGPRLIDGTDLNTQIARPHLAYQSGIVALAGGTRVAATPAITERISVVSTVANANDSVVLPAAIPGAFRLMRNAGANAVQVFATGSDTINGTAGSTGISVASAKSIMFFCALPGVWFSLLSA